MAFALPRAGDRFGQRAGGILPKNFATARYATPAIGHLVTQDTTASFNNGVIQATASSVPYGLVASVNSSNGTLSVWKLTKIVSAVFQYTGSPALGQQIQADGSAGTVAVGGNLRDRVKGVASGGVGLIVAIDEYATGFVTVEFGS